MHVIILFILLINLKLSLKINCCGHILKHAGLGHDVPLVSVIAPVFFLVSDLKWNHNSVTYLSNFGNLKFVMSFVWSLWFPRKRITYLMPVWIKVNQWICLQAICGIYSTWETVLLVLESWRCPIVFLR